MNFPLFLISLILNLLFVFCSLLWLYTFFEFSCLTSEGGHSLSSHHFLDKLDGLFFVKMTFVFMTRCIDWCFVFCFGLVWI